MNDKMAEQVKSIYSRYHANEISPEQALDELELVINEDTEDQSSPLDNPLDESQGDYFLVTND